MVVLHRINCVSCVGSTSCACEHSWGHSHTHTHILIRSIDRPPLAYTRTLMCTQSNPLFCINPHIIRAVSAAADVGVCLRCCRPVWTVSEQRELKYYIRRRTSCMVYLPTVWVLHKTCTDTHIDKSISLMDGLSISVVAMQHRIQARPGLCSHCHMRFTPFIGDGRCPWAEQSSATVWHAMVGTQPVHQLSS